MRSHCNTTTSITGRFCLLLFLLFAAIICVAAAEPTTPSCALLTDRALGLDTSSLVGLFETKLLESPKVHLLERAELTKLLNEQTLSQIFSPEGGTSRIATGKLLKADLLVLLKAEDGLDDKKQKTRRVQFVLSETHQGLRIQMGTVLWTANAEADADALCALVERGLEKYAEQVTEVCAVAPLVNQSASQQLDYLGGGYARLIQERLLSQRGMVVVEIAEAQAITRELALGGDNQVTRRTPLFISGEFRHAGTGTQQRVSLYLVLQRGNAKVAEFTRGELTPDAVGACLLEATQTLLAKADTVAMPQWNATEQAAQLAAQANLLKKTGNWGEALNVMDASLLLNPTQPQLLQDAALMCARIVTSYEAAYKRKAADPLWFVPDAEATLQYYYRIRSYLGAYLRQAPANTQNPYETALYGDFRFAMSNYLAALLRAGTTGPAELTASYKTIFEEQRDQATALVMQDAAAKKWAHLDALETMTQATEFECYNYGYTEQQQYDRWLRTLRLAHASPALEYFLVLSVSTKFYNQFTKERIATPGFAEFAKQVAAIGGPYMQALADYILVMRNGEHVDIKLPRPSELPPLRQDPPATPTTTMPVADATIAPVNITLQDENGQPVQKPLFFTTSWMPCGPGIDAMLNWDGLYLMKTKDVMKRVYRMPMSTDIFGMCFDGKFIWVLWHNKLRGKRDLTNLPKCFMVAVDPVSEKVITIGEDDGIIPSLTMKAAPWKPGSVVVAGYCGKSWCATVSVDGDGKKTVDIIHEAHNYPELDGWDPEGCVAADYAYDPGYVANFTEQATGNTMMLVGRSFFIGEQQVRHANPYPLIVDPVKRTVSVFPDKFAYSQPLVGLHGVLYFRQDGGRFVSVAYPDTKSRPITMPFASMTRGGMYYEQQRYHFRDLSKRLWLVSDNISGPFTSVKLDTLPDTYKIEDVHPSSHYGYVIFGSGPAAGVYQVEINGPSAKK